jgi:hypothetical protein
MPDTPAKAHVAPPRAAIDVLSEPAEIVRLALAVRVTAAGCLVGLLLCPKLWLSDRAYPLVPVASWWPRLPAPLDTLLLVGLVLALALAMALPRARWGTAIFLALLAVAAVGDQSRWQPWLYEYAALLAAAGLGLMRSADRPRSRAALAACRLIVAGVYFWSGAQKLHPAFVQSVFPWLVEPFVEIDPGSALERLGWGVPIAEIALAVGLLLPIARRAAVVLAAGMHATILLSIGPLGHDWNSVVWPWNLAMPAVCAALFWPRPRNLGAAVGGDSVAEALTQGPGTPQRAFPTVLPGLAIVLFWLLPALSLVEKWDAYLSASLYSGTVLQGRLEFGGDVRARLPDSARRVCRPAGRGRYELPMSDWSVAELNVPAYPARRVFRSVAAQFARAHGGRPGEVVLYIDERPDWRTAERAETRYELP